jgi:hypothetical protein
MLIDEKGKLFGKINILDLMVFVLVLVVIAGVAYKFTKSNAPTPFTQRDKIETVFYVEEVPVYSVAAVKQGAVVEDRVTGSVFGTVTAMDVQPSVSYAPDNNGKMVKSSKETYNSLSLTVVGNGTYSENRVTFKNIDYFINKQLEIRIGNVAVYTRIKSIKVLK